MTHDLNIEYMHYLNYDRMLNTTYYKLYLMAIHLYHNDNLSREQLITSLSTQHSMQVEADDHELSALITRTFVHLPSGMYSLHDEQRNALDFYFSQFVKHQSPIDFTLLIKDCHALHDNFMVELNKLQIFRSSIFFCQRYGLSINHSCFYFFYIWSEQSNIARDFDCLAPQVPEFHQQQLIEYFEFNQSTVDALHSLGIRFLGDLLKSSFYMLILLENVESLRTISVLTCFLCGSLTNRINELIDGCVLSFSENELYIVDNRLGLFDNSRMTLENIGQSLGLTRERVRQIESKTIERIKKLLSKHASVLAAFIILKSSEIGQYYLDVEVLVNESGLNPNWLYLLIQTAISQDYLSFRMFESMIYNQYRVSPNSVEQSILERLGDTLTIDETNDLYMEFRFAKNHVAYILGKNYRIAREIWVRKGLSNASIIRAGIDELFPNGYRISSKTDKKRLVDYLELKYGQDYSANLYDRTIEVAINNGDYYLVGRGMYLRSVFLPIMSQNLIDRIREYIISQSPAVFYVSIFEKFSKELRDEGIINQYMLKGLLDLRLSGEFYPKRDCIACEKDASQYKAIKDYIDRNHNEMFSLDDLKLKFPGVKDYVFTSFIAQHKEYLFLSDKRYVCVNQIMISPSVITSFEVICQTLFEKLQSKVITASKVYAHISIYYPQLFKVLPYVENHNDLFAILKITLQNRYYFSRPYICLEPMDVNHSETIRSYLETLATFTKMDIVNFCIRMHLRQPSSYLDFFEYISDSFIQVEQDKFESKSRFPMGQDVLTEIKAILLLFMSSDNSLQVSDSFGYALFPRINRRWNKYLFTGIIRTYLSQSFSVFYTENQFDKTNFVIRRNEGNEHS